MALLLEITARPVHVGYRANARDWARSQQESAHFRDSHGGGTLAARQVGERSADRAAANPVRRRVVSKLTEIFGEPNLTYRGVPRRKSNACCYGRDLMPRWRGPQVMDDDSKAMGWVCHECGREYPPAEVRNRRLLGEPRPE